MLTFRSSNSLTTSQCAYCNLRFDDDEKRREHIRANQADCPVHNACFPTQKIYEHTQNERHSMCSVHGCNSKYAKGTWTDEEMRIHVYYEHTDEG